jgi:hypothetical protein
MRRRGQNTVHRQPGIIFPCQIAFDPAASCTFRVKTAMSATVKCCGLRRMALATDRSLADWRTLASLPSRLRQKGHRLHRLRWARS